MLGVILQRMLCKNDFGELRRGAPRKSQSNFFLRQCNHGNAVCLNSSEAGTILKVPYDTIINIEMGLKQGQLLTRTIYKYLNEINQFIEDSNVMPEF